MWENVQCKWQGYPVWSLAPVLDSESRTTALIVGMEKLPFSMGLGGLPCKEVCQLGLGNNDSEVLEWQVPEQEEPQLLFPSGLWPWAVSGMWPEYLSKWPVLPLSPGSEGSCTTRTPWISGVYKEQGRLGVPVWWLRKLEKGRISENSGLHEGCDDETQQLFIPGKCVMEPGYSSRNLKLASCILGRIRRIQGRTQDKATTTPLGGVGVEGQSQQGGSSEDSL